MLCRRTRQIIAYFIGGRGKKSCQKLWDRVPAEYKRCVSYSDYWETYQAVIQTGKHQSVGKESGETAHIERLNNTIRQRVGRCTRQTLSFSKTDDYHQIVLKNFILDYNMNIFNTY